MTVPNIDTNKIQEFIDRRLEIIKDAGSSLLLGDNLTDLVLATFSDFVKSFITISSSNDSSYFSKKFDEFYTSMIQPMPSDELAASGIAGLSHKKFTTLSQAILLHPECGDFFHAAIKDGCNVSVKALGDFKGNLHALQDVFINHLQELGPYLTQLENNPQLALSEIITNRQPEITKLATDMHLKMFELYAGLKKYSDFASAKAESIYDIAHELNTLLTGIDGLKNMPTSLGDLTTTLTGVRSLWDQGHNLIKQVNNMAVIDESIKNGIDYHSLLDRNMKVLLDASRNMVGYCANLSVALSHNDNALEEATRQINSMLPYIKGLMKGMAQKNMVTKLFEPSPNRSMLDTLKNSLSALVSPTEEINRVKNDFQATIQMTKDLMHGKLPYTTAIPTLISRIQNNVNTITSYVDMATSAFNAYVPVISDFAQSAFQALKNTAPTPLLSLSTGDIKSFQQALIDPRAITKVGPVMAELSNFLKNTSGLTAVQVSTANKLLDFVAREHTRESISTYLADADLQKAIALSGLKKFVQTDINPIQNTLDVFKNMMTP